MDEMEVSGIHRRTVHCSIFMCSVHVEGKQMGLDYRFSQDYRGWQLPEGQTYLGPGYLGPDAPPPFQRSLEGQFRSEPSESRPAAWSRIRTSRLVGSPNCIAAIGRSRTSEPGRRAAARFAFLLFA